MCYEQWDDMQCMLGRELGKCGSKEMARWVVHCGSSIYESVCLGAASNGRAELLEWLFSKESGIYVRIQDRVTSLLVHVAGEASTFAVFESVWKCICVSSSIFGSGVANRRSLLNELAHAAVEAGLPEALMLMLDKGASPTSETYRQWTGTAASAGHTLHVAVHLWPQLFSCRLLLLE
jgi:hypothetical protein